jgi:hypothetical protein
MIKNVSLHESPISMPDDWLAQDFPAPHRRSAFRVGRRSQSRCSAEWRPAFRRKRAALHMAQRSVRLRAGQSAVQFADGGTPFEASHRPLFAITAEFQKSRFQLVTRSNEA